MNVEKASEILQAISDPNRLLIVKHLTKNLHVSAKEFLPIVNCKQATLSYHLSDMVKVGILNSKKSGHCVFYSLNARTYTQLLSYFESIDRINKTNVEPKKQEAKKVEPKVEKQIEIPVEKPVVKTIKPIIKKEQIKETKSEEKEEKKSLPTFLL